MKRSEVDPDITRPETLHEVFHLDPAAWEQTREQVFTRGWRWLLGTLDAVAEPGALPPRWLLPGLLLAD